MVVVVSETSSSKTFIPSLVASAVVVSSLFLRFVEPLGEVAVVVAL
jgi:hypothetical protein